MTINIITLQPFQNRDKSLEKSRMASHPAIGQIIHETAGNQTIRLRVGRRSPTTREADSEHQTTIPEEALATPDPTVPIHRVQTDHEVKVIEAIKALVVQETVE